jgi:hypothetical protein
MEAGSNVMPVLDPDITDRWVTGEQHPSANRLEAARTEVPGLFACHSTYDRRNRINATAEQLIRFAEDILNPDTELGRMVQEGRQSRGANGHSTNGYGRDRDRDRDRDRGRERA